MQFEDHFVAYLDILGFSQLAENEESVIKITKAVRKIAKDKPTEAKFYPEESINLTFQSDSIILSIKQSLNKYDNYKSLRFLLSVIQNFQLQCAEDDIYLRGGVSLGRLLYENTTCVGKGLLNAYILEQYANYPRIIIDNGLINFFNLSSSNEFISQLNIMGNAIGYSGNFIFDEENHLSNRVGIFSDDGIMFIHYLHGFNKPESKLLNNLKNNLLKFNNPRIHQKYKWIIDYSKSIID